MEMKQAIVFGSSFLKVNINSMFLRNGSMAMASKMFDRDDF